MLSLKVLFGIHPYLGTSILPIWCPQQQVLALKAPHIFTTTLVCIQYFLYHLQLEYIPFSLRYWKLFAHLNENHTSRKLTASYLQQYLSLNFQTHNEYFFLNRKWLVTNFGESNLRYKFNKISFLHKTLSINMGLIPGIIFL